MEDYYWQALLSEAAYAENLSKDMFGQDDASYTDALIDDGKGNVRNPSHSIRQ